MTSKLIAFTVRRRVISAAIFAGKSLEYVDVVHLEYDLQRGVSTLFRFAAWLIQHFSPETAVITGSGAMEGEKTRVLTRELENLLRTEGIPIWKLPTATLLESYSVSKLKAKSELNAIALSFWPQIERKQLPGIDAALAGFYVQVERLLSEY